MNTVEVVRNTYEHDNVRTRKVVCIGQQHFLISHSEHFAPEVAMCRVPPGDDPDWDGSTEFWARSGMSIDDAVEALRNMTEGQYMSDEVDRPDLEDVAWGFLVSRGRA